VPKLSATHPQLVPSSHQSPSNRMSTSTYQPPPGRLGNLSAQQQSALDQFRHDLSTDANFPWTPARHDDATLLRFLRARKFDLAKSKEMIYAAEKWRKDFGVDEIVKSVTVHCWNVDIKTLTMDENAESSSFRRKRR
jgi:hypothetical protein